MKKIFPLLAAVVLLAACNKDVVECSVPAHISDGSIVLSTPDRAPGQTSALKMACEPLDTVRIAFVGLGSRGLDAVRRYQYIEGVKVVALCDMLQERIDKALEMVSGAPLTFCGDSLGAEKCWQELCEVSDADLVYVCTDWKWHTPIAVYAMEHGKHVAVEVPAATNIDECWQLVNTSERTRKHCMMLENCCYDFFEMTALNMVQQGVLGEIYHAEGAYIHNLDAFWDKYYDNWRLAFNQKHRGDNYPTHGIGPVCQVLDIHRGDRMDYVVSMDTESYRGAAFAKEKMGVDEFADGDHTVSLIRTVKGHQIEIQHNVYALRPYSRMYQLTGTKGFANKYPVQGFSVSSSNLPDKEIYRDLNPERLQRDEVFDELMKDFKHPITEYYEKKALEVGGHGGMDFIMDSRLIYCLRKGLPLDEDVYDAAEWSCLTELSRLSIENGSMPVKVPDFTRGDWDVVKGFNFEF